MKRYLVYPFDFDTRAATLNADSSGWDADARELQEQNVANTIARLRVEYGEKNFEQKLENFKALGSRPFSIIGHHNLFYHEACNAFVHAFYFPALAGACALGERILNHLILDLREEFRATPEYRKVAGKDSFDNWSKAIAVLKSWSVFQTQRVAREFELLGALRNRSLHFNPATYESSREDALSALTHLAAIISDQFGFASLQRWMLPGTAGAFFIRKESEGDPFIRKYYLPQCPYVGPMFSINFVQPGVMFFDSTPADAPEISDEEFARLQTTRLATEVTPSAWPPAEGVRVQLRPHGGTILHVTAAEPKEEPE